MLHIIQNDPEVPPGNISLNLDRWGTPYFIHHPYLGDPLPDPRDITAVIVLGGAMSANDDQQHPFLIQVKLFISKIVEQQIPYLGICLGGQLLAVVCGGKVVQNRWEETGTLDVNLTDEGKTDQLLCGTGETFSSFQWHHDSFDLPPGSLLLASSAACPNQAFRIRDRFWGTQFHPEVTEEIIRNWCAWDPETKDRSDELVSRWRDAEGYENSARMILANFLKSAGITNKTPLLF